MNGPWRDGDGELERALNLDNREGGGVHFTAEEAGKLGPAADATTAAAAREHNPGADLVIVEGVAGVFFYHLGLATDTTRSLCGVRTMATLLPLATWGMKTHLGERYCPRCQVDAAKAGLDSKLGKK